MENPKLRPIEILPFQQQGRRLLLLRDPAQVKPVAVTMSLNALPILRCLDGTNSLLDIQAAYARAGGDLLFRDDLERLLRHLDDALLLDSAHYRAERARMEAEFREAPVRPMSHAGGAYPAEPDAFRAELERQLAVAGPPRAPARPAAVVSPHIDYARGGATYAHAWAGVALDGYARAVILGTSHHAGERFALTAKDHETPFGVMPADRDFIAGLERRCSFDLRAGEFAHRAEHSVELVAVLLHALAGGRELPIVPILCGSFHDCVAARRSPAEAADVAGTLGALRETIAAAPGETLVIAAADLSHMGPRFGDPEPMGPAALGSLEVDDRRSLAAAAAGDAEGFYRSIADHGDRRKVCGLPPIYALLALAPGAAGAVGDYRQCVDPDTGSVVTIAAMRFERGGRGGR